MHSRKNLLLVFIIGFINFIKDLIYTHPPSKNILYYQLITTSYYKFKKNDLTLLIIIFLKNKIKMGENLGRIRLNLIFFLLIWDFINWLWLSSMD